MDTKNRDHPIAKLKKAYDLISAINKEAYKDKILVSNQVLTKHPYNNNFLNRFLNDESPKKQRIYKIFYKLFRYYIKNLLHLGMFIIKFTEYLFSHLRFYPSGNFDEIIIIDTYFLTEKIREARGYFDRYFLGLEDILKKIKKHYIFLPFFYSSYHNKMPLELYGVLKILKKEKIPVIIEYQLLSMRNFIDLLRFVIVYPFHVLRLIKKLPTDAAGIGLLRDELIDTLDQVTFYSYWRYLQGKELARLPYKRIKVISWYENQAIHKNLYMGLKEINAEVAIYGGKLCLYSKNFISELPDENEVKFGIVPDKIVANGDYYIPQESQFNYIIGPSLRYKMIFDTKVDKKNQKDTLILLPFFPYDSRNILKMFFTSCEVNEDVIIKIHPLSKIEEYENLIPVGVRITTDDIYEIFKTTKIAIGAASGVLVEAISLGIPVITVKNSNAFDYNNPLPEYGRSIVWEEVATPQELRIQIERLKETLENRPTEINTIADKYKKMFFHEISQENIIKAFDL